MKKYFLIILLTVVFIGLLIFVVYSMRNNTKPAPPKVIFQTNAGNIASINVNSVSSYKIEKKGSNNILMAPTEVPADKSALVNMVNSASKIEYISIVLEATKDLSQFGLDNHKNTITINTSDGKSKTIIFGDTTPDNSGVYAKAEDANVIYNVSSDVSSKLTQSVDNLIQKQILTSIGKTKIDKIDVLYNNKTYIFTKNNNIWSYNSIQLKKETTDEALNKFVSFNADGLSSTENYVNVNTIPALKVIAYQANNKVLNLSFIKKSDDIYNVIEEGMPVQYYISASSFDNFINNFTPLISELK